MDLEVFLDEWHNDSPTVMVHTSGSTGAPKPMLVEKRRMEASARITCGFLGLKAGDTALLCMSLDYIAGKMMVVRALTCGLKLITVEPSGHPLSDASLNNPLSSFLRPSGSKRPSAERLFPPSTISLVAMVPMQVYNSLQVPEERERLKAIKHLIIGGGAIDEAMAQELKTFPNAVWSTYGMTETLSHIALRRLSGPEASEWYVPFEGVSLSLTEEGCLVIDAPAVHDGPLVTNDIAELELASIHYPPSTIHRFRILGRRDNVICSGGIKIQIEEVEKLLRPRLSVPFMISKRPDEKFGEQVVLLTESKDVNAVKDVCQRVLPKYWQPRSYLHVNQLPMTETGKPARKEAERLAALAIEV